MMNTQTSGNRYWAAKARCGHVGRAWYIPIIFAIKAASAAEAAARTRQLPRVKHHHAHAILDVQPIALDEYCALREANRRDPYLLSCNIQQQRMIPEITERILPEEDREATDGGGRRPESRCRYYNGKTFVRNPKRYARMYPDAERLSRSIR